MSAFWRSFLRGYSNDKLHAAGLIGWGVIIGGAETGWVRWVAVVAAACGIWLHHSNRRALRAAPRGADE